MKLFELFESLDWANSRDEAYGSTKNNFDSSNYVLKWVNIEDVMNNTEGMQRISLKARTKADDPNIIGDRVSRAENFWATGGKMNPSELGWNKYTNAINFGDGRHRMLAAFQAGEEYARAFVYKNGFEEVAKRVRMK